MDIIRGIAYYFGYIYGSTETMDKEEITACISVIHEASKGGRNTLNEELLEYFKKKNIIKIE